MRLKKVRMAIVVAIVCAVTACSPGPSRPAAGKTDGKATDKTAGKATGSPTGKPASKPAGKPSAGAPGKGGGITGGITGGRPAELPGGGRVMFPGHRLVALYGHPGAPGLGALGQQDLPETIARARKMAGEYRSISKIPVIPAFEIIATVADNSPGADGSYSAQTPVSQLRPWIQRATREGLYVMLDLQPGRASLLDQARRYQSLLQQPNVGLALDPEWKLQPGQRPLQQIGSVDIGEVNSVVRWLAALTERYRLPQKVLVLHQFRSSMIMGERELDTRHRDLAIVLHMDGRGTPEDKQATWNMVTGGAPRGVFLGWKNFFDADTPMISPRATLARGPVPVLISYE